MEMIFHLSSHPASLATEKNSNENKTKSAKTRNFSNLSSNATPSRVFSFSSHFSVQSKVKSFAAPWVGKINDVKCGIIFLYQNTSILHVFRGERKLFSFRNNKAHKTSKTVQTSEFSVNIPSPRGYLLLISKRLCFSCTSHTYYRRAEQQRTLLRQGIKSQKKEWEEVWWKTLITFVCCLNTKLRGSWTIRQ